MEWTAVEKLLQQQQELLVMMSSQFSKSPGKGQQTKGGASSAGKGQGKGQGKGKGSGNQETAPRRWSPTAATNFVGANNQDWPKPGATGAAGRGQQQRGPSSKPDNWWCVGELGCGTGHHDNSKTACRKCKMPRLGALPQEEHDQAVEEWTKKKEELVSKATLPYGKVIDGKIEDWILTVNSHFSPLAEADEDGDTGEAGAAAPATSPAAARDAEMTPVEDEASAKKDKDKEKTKEELQKDLDKVSLNIEQSKELGLSPSPEALKLQTTLRQKLARDPKKLDLVAALTDYETFKEKHQLKVEAFQLRREKAEAELKAVHEKLSKLEEEAKAENDYFEEKAARMSEAAMKMQKAKHGLHADAASNETAGEHLELALQEATEPAGQVAFFQTAFTRLGITSLAQLQEIFVIQKKKEEVQPSPATPVHVETPAKDGQPPSKAPRTTPKPAASSGDGPEVKAKKRELKQAFLKNAGKVQRAKERKKERLTADQNAGDPALDADKLDVDVSDLSDNEV